MEDWFSFLYALFALDRTNPAVISMLVQYILQVWLTVRTASVQEEVETVIASFTDKPFATDLTSY